MKPQTLELLCNPYKGEPFRQEGEELVGLASGQRFRIREGIPVIIPPQSLPRRARRIQKFYDSVAPIYDTVIDWGSRTGIGSETWIRQEIIAQLPIKPGDKVLETAVGSALNLSYLPEHGDYYGQDISWGMLRRARRNMAASSRAMELFQTDGAYLPFRDDLFDHIIHMGGLQFYADPFRGVNEMARVLKPGATVTIIDQARPAMRMLRKMPAHKKYAPDLASAVTNMVRLVPFTMTDYHSSMLAGGEFFQLTFKKPPTNM